MFFGRNYAPGGYAWLFPRDRDVANVGLVVGKRFSKEAPARKAMSAFLEQVYPGAKVETLTGGAIPCGYTHDPLAAENLFKAGDSANMVNPISRAGILEAMAGGRFAAEAALETVGLDREEERRPCYARYQAKWEKAYGGAHRRLCRAKKAFGEVPDAVFNRAAHGLARLPHARRTLPRIFLATLWQSPSLLWKMRGLFVPK
jgi:digeranylgeranylglycerophospholipid reductase